MSSPLHSSDMFEAWQVQSPWVTENEMFSAFTTQWMGEAVHKCYKEEMLMDTSVLVIVGTSARSREQSRHLRGGNIILTMY